MKRGGGDKSSPARAHRGVNWGTQSLDTRQPPLVRGSMYEKKIVQDLGGKGAPLHCVYTARYFLDQVPVEESPSTPVPNALISPLP